MKKGLYYNILSAIFMITLLLINIAPFSINADYLGTAPYVGFNIWVEDYDNEYNMSLNSGTGTLTVNGSNSSLVLGQFTSNGKTYWSTGQAPSGTTGMNINGTITLNQSSSSIQVVRRVIHVDIILDNNYVGYIKCRVRDSNNSSNVLFNQELAINGNSTSFQFVDSNTSLTNTTYIISFDEQLLIENNSNERWNFPIESFNAIYPLLYNNYKISSINQYNSYIYPIFNISSGSILYTNGGVPKGDYLDLIFAISPSSITVNNFTQFFDIRYSSNNTFDIEFIRYITPDIKADVSNPDSNFRFVHYRLNNNNNATVTYSIYASRDIYFMPIYNQWGSYSKNITTDFALQFGLSNSLLDNINIIANGNQGSNNSVNDNDNNNQLLDDTNSEYEAIEQQFNENMNDSLDDINMQSDLLSNQDFLNSASFVKTQFNRLLNNTILGSLIIFFLLLGLASIFIGRNK